MTDLHTPTLFTRHNRPLHALWLESQAWFCAQELGRLTGRHYDQHGVRRLDPDQHRVVRLRRYEQYQDTLMISESGAYTLLAHNYVPENRHLRRWLTHEVVAVLRAADTEDADASPQLGRMCWAGGRMSTLLYWQSEAWVKMRDMPVVLALEAAEAEPSGMRKDGWRECAQRALRMHGV